MEEQTQGIETLEILEELPLEESSQETVTTTEPSSVLETENPPASESTSSESATPQPEEIEESLTQEESLQVITLLQEEIAKLKNQLDQQVQQTESYKSQFVRLGADFENFRRRTQKEKEEMETEIKCKTINELLAVVDNFERARTQIKPQTEAETTIHKSYQGVYKQLVDSLKRIGVSPMRPEGKPFDPTYHEAVWREATNDHPEGTVLEELQRGYLLGEKVLRHSMVKVSVPLEGEDQSSSTETVTPSAEVENTPEMANSATSEA